LISKSTDPVRGIDYKRREVCLCPHPWIDIELFLGSMHQ
jgi:hypothetical protein